MQFRIGLKKYIVVFIFIITYQVTMIEWENVCETKLKNNINFHLNDLFAVDSSIYDFHLLSHRNINNDSKMAACLIRNNGRNYIALYELDENKNVWRHKLQTEIRNGNRISTINFNGGTLIILVETSSNGKNYNEYIIVYHLDDNQYFHRVQKILSEPVDDVAVWSNKNHIFLATICSAHENNKNSLSPIYMWKGTHFDIIQFIPTLNARKIILFEIQGKIFIGIINNGNSQGNKEAFSEIFQYNTNNGLFEMFQRIKSIGATEIRLFSLHNEVANENFLLITNIINDEYKEGGSTESVSIIYKYDQKFIPLQRLYFNGLEKWVLMEENDITYLVAVTKVNIAAYAYDGWTFSITNIDQLRYKIDCIQSYLQPSTAKIIDEVKSSKSKTNQFDQIALEWTTSLINQLLLSNSHFELTLQRFRQISTTMSGQIKLVTNLDKAIIEKITFNDFSTNNFKYMDILYLMEMGIQATSLLQIIQSTFLTMATYRDLFNIPKLMIGELEVISNDITMYNNLYIDNLNDCNLHDFQNKIMYSLRNSTYLYIPQLAVKQLKCRTINQLATKKLKDEMNKLFLENEIIVNGNIYIQNDMVIKGAIDGVNFSPNKLILRNGDQKLTGEIMITNLKTFFFDTNEINASSKNSLIFNNDKIKATLENKFKKLVVRRMNVQNLFGHINIQNLKKNTLKREGNQILRANFTFMKLTANTMQAKNRFSRNDFVDVANGDYIIREDLSLSDAEFASLRINQHLNNIFVNNGQLDILKKSSNDKVLMTGKTFDNVVIMKPLNLQGHIVKPIFKDTNLVTAIEQPMILQGNYTILGTMFVEKSMAANTGKI